VSKTILYHVPPSLCSQKVRLALVEKGVHFEGRLVDIGPTSENYEPWYVRINPGAVIPTLVHGEMVVTDSARIIRYVDRTYEGPALVPVGLEDEVEAWIDRADHFPLREVTFQSAPGFLTEVMLGRKIKKLEKLSLAHPELAEIYERKLRDIQGLKEDKASQQGSAERLVQLDGLLAEVERRLAQHAFVVGDRYTLADVMWTTFLTRLEMLKLVGRVRAHEHLSAYYDRMKARPSYQTADLFPRMRPTFVLTMLRAKFPKVFYGGIAVLLTSLLGVVALLARGF
jgi:glutathione S-transferase